MDRINVFWIKYLTPMAAVLVGSFLIISSGGVRLHADEAFIAEPYVLQVDHESVRIVWVTPSDRHTGAARVTGDGGRTDLRVASEVTTPWFQDIREGGGFKELDHVRHVVRVDGLRASSDYEYQVWVPGGETGSIRSGSFSTAPESGSIEPFEFIMVSDGHAGSRRYHQVARAVGAESPAFVVHTGDLTSGWGAHWDNWQRYFRVARPYLESTALVPVVGGHDVGPNRNFRSLFLFNDPEGDPADEDDQGTWYTFSYGNLDFFILDHTADLQAQLEWIEEQLAASNAEWKIVATHATFSAVSGAGNLFRDRYFDFAQVFEKYGVDLVVAGHNHIYERCLPLGSRGAKPVHYITINSGGNFREVRPSPISVGGRGYQVRMYAHFKVHGNRLVMEAKAEYPAAKAGRIIDRLELIKDERGNYQDEIMNLAVDKDLAIDIGHIFTGNMDMDKRYSRRDIIGSFERFPRDDGQVWLTLNVPRFPLDSTLVIYEQDDPQGWRTEAMELPITGDTVRFQVTAPERYGTAGRSWSVNRGTRVDEPLPEFLMNIKVAGRKFEPALVRPSFGVMMESRVGLDRPVVKADRKYWIAQSSGVNERLRAVSAYSSELSVAVGDGTAGRPVALLFNGREWKPLPEFADFVNSREGRARNWHNLERLYGVSALAPDNLWIGSYMAAAGSHGRLAVWDGSGWRDRATGTGRRITGLAGTIEAGDTILWAGRISSLVYALQVPEGEDLVEDGSGSLRDLSESYDVDGTVWTVGGSGSDNMWAAVDGALFQSADSGDTWVKKWQDEITAQAIFSLSPTQNWFSRGGEILYYDGSERVVMHDAGASIRGIYAAGKDRVWAVGDNAVIVYYDGVEWINIDLSGLGGLGAAGTFWDIAGTQSSEGIRLWVVGDDGQIFAASPERP